MVTSSDERRTGENPRFYGEESKVMAERLVHENTDMIENKHGRVGP